MRDSCTGAASCWRILHQTAGRLNFLHEQEAVGVIARFVVATRQTGACRDETAQTQSGVPGPSNHTALEGIAERVANQSGGPLLPGRYLPPPRLAGRKMRRWWWWSRSRNVTGRAFQSIRLCEEPRSCGVGPTVACCEPGRHRQCEDRYPRPRGKQRRTAKRAGAGSENLRRLLLHQEHLFPIRWASSKAPVLLLRHASG